MIDSLYSGARRFALKQEQRWQVCSNLTELINTHKAAPRPEHLTWLRDEALKASDSAEVALAALCLGLLEYDKGFSPETR